MDKQFIADLTPNVRVNSHFAVKEKSLAAFRNKPGKFMSLTLSDATGQITGRVWNDAEELAEGFAEGDVVEVKGAVEEYQGNLQLIIAHVAKAEPGDYDVEDLLARAGRSRAELLRWLEETVALVEQPHLQALLQAFFGDEQFRDAFADAHGAKALHHAYVGGLLEHTLSVAQILVGVIGIHPEMNRDMLVTGALLHDIGKLQELSGAVAANYTDIGKLIGHTVLADRMIGEKILGIEEFPPHLANLLSHMILSHHGEREWGAPIVPATMEACALHYADNLDARVQGFKQIIQAGADSGNKWSEYHRSYQREIYLGPVMPPDEEMPADQDEETTEATAKDQVDDSPVRGDQSPGGGQLQL